MPTQIQLKNRRKFIRDYISSQSEKGVKVSFSVDILANKILFISERAIYKDLATFNKED